MSNRRSFLKTSLAAAGAALVPTLCPRVALAQSAGIPQYLQEGTNGVHAIHTANCWVGNINPTDWANLGVAHNAIAKYDGSSGYAISAAISAAASRANAQMNTNLDATEIVQRIQAYQPAFPLSDWQTLVSYFPRDTNSISKALTYLQQPYGFYKLINETVGTFEWMKGVLNGSITLPNGALTPPQLFDRSVGLIPAGYHAVERMRLERVEFQPHPAKPFAKEGGGGGYTCEVDGAFNLAMGTAFLVIGAMTMGTAPVLIGAAWAGIAVWGGFATGGWALAHAMECGF